MGWRIHVTDENEKVVAEISHSGRCYLLPDGKRCRMSETVGWCRDCARFVAAERVPSLAHVEEMLESIRAGPEAYKRKITSLYGELSEPDWVIEKELFIWGWQLKRWESVRVWRLMRRSGSRCLHCFSTDIELLPVNAMKIVHPISGQRLYVVTVSHLSMNAGPEYTVEGLPLEGADARNP